MTDLDLTGRRALVTGGAQGLGEGMARRWPRPAQGRRSRTCRTTSALRSPTRSATGHAFVRLDVTDDADWEAAVADTVGQLGGLDILVNNAGVEITSLLVDLDPARRRASSSRSTCSGPHSASSTPSAPCGPAARPAPAAW